MATTKVIKDFLKFRQHIRQLNISVNEQFLLELLFEFHNYKHGYSYPEFKLLMKAFNTTSKNRISATIKKLEEKELIEVSRSVGEGNKYFVKGIESFMVVSENQKVLTPKKKEKTDSDINKPSIDSNGNLPLDGQIHYTDVENGNTSESDNVKTVLDKYPYIKMSEKQKEIINSTDKDTLEFALDSIFVDEVNTTYLLGAIERAKEARNKVIKFPNGQVNPKSFNNFEAREYDYDSLEDQLRGFEEPKVVVGEKEVIVFNGMKIGG